MSQDDCIFCSILKDKRNILFENENLFVILDRYPISKGHLLVIPKIHVPYLHDISDDNTMNILKMIKRLVNIYGWKKYNVLQNNENMQSVKHVHFHLIPCHDDDDRLVFAWKQKSVSDEDISSLYKEMKNMIENKTSFI